MNRFTLRIGGLAVLIAFLAPACLTGAERQEAVRIALDDPRFAELLENEYKVTNVREAGSTPDDDAVVEVSFVHPVAISEWPTDLCDVPEQGDDLTGARWLVSLTTETVVAVTPLWGEVACFDA